MAQNSSSTSIIPAGNAAAVPTSGGGSDDPRQNLNNVINSIEKTLRLLHQLYLNVFSFNLSSQLPLLHRLYLDRDGKNPDEFTRDIFNSCIARNQITTRKTDAFKGLRKHLLEELEEAFPDKVEAYREIRASSAAESKRLAQAQSMLPNGDAKVKSDH